MNKTKLELWTKKAREDDCLDQFFVPSDLREMLGEIERLRGLMKNVQEHCAGEALPRWDKGERTNNSRCYLLDICNAALD